MILSSAAYQNNGLIIITWDEGESGVDGPIGMIVLSPWAKGGGYHNAIRYTHSATLRTLADESLGSHPLLGGAATAPDLSDLFVNGAIPKCRRAQHDNDQCVECERRKRHSWRKR